MGTTVGASTYSYSYDNRGNMGTMPHLSSMAWNASNELAGITKGSEPTYYQYSNGQRVRKYTNKISIKEERTYLGNYELYRKYDSTGTVIEIERTTVHVSDDTGRIAMVETLIQEPNPEVLQRYIYSNHLQSASLELDETAGIISYEEYHPYGTTAYQAMNASINAVAKRYRFGSKERDDESGLYYHGARYYIPWLARWTAVDPMESDYAGMSPYNYAFNNPVVFNDPSGNQPEGVLKSFEVQKEYHTGFAPSGHDVLIPKGFQVQTYTPTNDKGEAAGISTVIAIKSPAGDIFKWSDKSRWFTSEQGEDYSNPGFLGLTFDISNWLSSTTQATLGQIALDALEKGDPFATMKESYGAYKEQGGSFGVLGFIGTGVKESVAQTYEDIQAGGYRRNQAIIGVWQGGSQLAKGSLLSASKSLKSVWGLPPSQRGLLVEKMLGGNLPAAFKTIDKFDAGIATSIKSIDLTVPTYLKPAALKSRLEGYVNKVAEFSGGSRGNWNITSRMIQGRSLDLAIQAGKGTREQLKIINQLIQYGKDKGVNVNIYKIR